MKRGSGADTVGAAYGRPKTENRPVRVAPHRESERRRDETRNGDESQPDFQNLGELLEASVEAIDELEPPQWAAEQVAHYQDVTRDLQEVVSRSVTLFAQGRDAITLPKIQRLERRYRRVTVAERKARKAMLKAVGAAPTTQPGGKPAPEADDEEVA